MKNVYNAKHRVVTKIPIQMMTMMIEEITISPQFYNVGLLQLRWVLSGIFFK